MSVVYCDGTAACKVPCDRVQLGVDPVMSRRGNHRNREHLRRQFRQNAFPPFLNIGSGFLTSTVDVYRR